LKIKVRFFASYREIAGMPEVVLDLREGTTLSALIEDMKGKYPKLGSLTDTIIASVNKRYAKEDVVLKEGDEVALLPPVSGG
jgi:molybdopterin converting factor subunit 1